MKEVLGGSPRQKGQGWSGDSRAEGRACMGNSWVNLVTVDIRVQDFTTVIQSFQAKQMERQGTSKTQGEVGLGRALGNAAYHVFA